MSNLWACHVLVRTDLKSLNPGKVAAQVHHAGTALVCRHQNGSASQRHALENWLDSENVRGLGFGTVLVFAVAGNEPVDPTPFPDESYYSQLTAEQRINKYVEMAIQQGDPAGLIIDPEFPVTDGKVIHKVPNVLTCGYFLSYRHANDKVVSEMKRDPLVTLYP